ncbi:PEGA domain protein [Enhygromyxa salina]|uniref:PEGA domain protein n=1 Tax=Enhygromyxa salina TaxID=215803 RepID=A0A2S9XED9_9BACT|nr:PEGA domain-containing protein [Enhygromyxa salina]PRP91236.1 PEGA domain protein [Enhygromyxa salina]
MSRPRDLLCARLALARLALAVFAAIGLATPAAHASAPPAEATPDPSEASVALLPVVFADALPEDDERALEDVVGVAFEHPELELVRGPRVERARASNCPGEADEACLRAIGRELGVTHVVTVVVHARDRDFEVELQALTVAGSGRPSEIEVECLVCGIAEVQDRVAAQAALLRERVLIDTQPGRIAIEGSPDAATVSIDGRRVGRLPYEAELGSGEHQLLVSSRGYYDALVPVSVAPGTVEQVWVELEVDPNSRGRRSWQRPVGWAAVGAGVAGIGVGVGLLVIDGRPYLGRCDDPANLGVNGECKWLYQSLGAGVGVLALGMVAANVGTTLLILDRWNRRQAPTSAATARRRERAASLKLRVGLGQLELSGQF